MEKGCERMFHVKHPGLPGCAPSHEPGRDTTAAKDQDWEPARQSERRSGKPRQSGGASRGGAPAEGAPAAAFGPNGLAPASPTEGREAGRQRMLAMHDYRGLPTEARRETPGRKKWRGRRIVHSEHSLPCAGKRSVAGRSPARVPSCAPPPTRTDVSRETFRLTGMRTAPTSRATQEN